MSVPTKGPKMAGSRPDADDVRRLVDFALRLADEGFEDHVNDLIEASERDWHLMVAAMSILTARLDGGSTSLHVACTYLAAASRRVLEEQENI
jgi:hypothetical protein